jgi:hypothetical protein
MTASKHTRYYGLSQYARNDRPTYTGDYNGDMSKIDEAIHAASLSGGVDGLTAVSHDGTLTGNGTKADALSVIGSFRNATRLEGSSSSKFDPGDCVDAGVYYIAMGRDEANEANLPPDLKDLFIRASLVVCKCGYGDTDIAQLWLNRSGGEGEPFVAYRIDNGVWTPWRRLAFADDLPDVSALTDRVSALESRVSALADAVNPSAPQVDTRHCDDYDIDRAIMPSRSNESEETHHE